MHLLRVRLKGLAAAVLCALAVVSLAAAAHEQVHHRADVAGVAIHDASAHAFGPHTDRAAHPLHCVLCHWTRHLRPRASDLHAHAPAEISSALTGALTCRLPADRAGLQPPLRAPPASDVLS